MSKTDKETQDCINAVMITKPANEPQQLTDLDVLTIRTMKLEINNMKLEKRITALEKKLATKKNNKKRS